MAALTKSLSELGVYFLLLFMTRSCIGQNSTTVDPGINTTDVTNATIPATVPTTQPPTTTPTTTTPPPTTTLAPNVPGTSIPTDTDFSRCPCDLTGLACDVNCCCDPDCSTDDKRVFSECLRNSYRLDDKLCFDRDVILYENGPEYSNTTDDLFCIYFDNEEERNYYQNPSLITTVAKIQEYADDYGTFSFQPAPVSTPTAEITNYYKSGDPMYVVFPSEAVSYLALPTAISASPVCTDGNPAAFLKDQTVSCTRMVSDLATQCQTTPGFNAPSFYQDMRLVRDPFLLQAYNSTTTVVDPVLGTVDLSGVTNLYNNEFTLEFELDPNSTLRCVNTAGVESTCAFATPPANPTLVGNECRNVLTKVEYRFITEGTFGVKNAYVSFMFTDITTPSVTQSFQTVFTTKADASDVFQRSGNPGYVVGKPIMAGILNETQISSTETQQTILLTQPLGQQLAVVKPSVTGTCGTASGQREPVVFGQNVRTGCFIEISQSNNVCPALQRTIIEALEGYAVPTFTDGSYPANDRYVAMFGNSQVSRTGDWLPILYQNRPPPPQDTNECFLSLGMDIQIVYANVGALANPQPKIIGVSFVYDIPQTVKYRCSGPFCQPGSGNLVQRVEISSSVTFIDASKPPQEVESEYPTFAVRLPYDFFYPFLNSGGNRREPGIVCLIVCLCVKFAWIWS